MTNVKLSAAQPGWVSFSALSRGNDKRSNSRARVFLAADESSAVSTSRSPTGQWSRMMGSPNARDWPFASLGYFREKWTKPTGSLLLSVGSVSTASCSSSTGPQFGNLDGGYIASSRAESGKAEDAFALSIHQRLQDPPLLKKVCRAQNFLQGHLKSAVLNTLSRGLVLAEFPTGPKRLSPEYRAVNDWLTDPHNS